VGLGQTTYNTKMQAMIAGMIVGLDHQIESFICDEAIGFGLGVVKGAITNGGNLNKGSVKLPDANTDVFRGISILRHGENPYPYSSSGDTYAQNEVAGIMRKGQAVVQTDGDSNTIDSTVYVTTDGKFTSTEGTNATATGCVFRSIDTALGLAILEVNLPQ